jgi:hypothetical protein
LALFIYGKPNPNRPIVTNVVKNSMIWALGQILGMSMVFSQTCAMNCARVVRMRRGSTGKYGAPVQAISTLLSSSVESQSQSIYKLRK